MKTYSSAVFLGLLNLAALSPVHSACSQYAGEDPTDPGYLRKLQSCQIKVCFASETKVQVMDNDDPSPSARSVPIKDLKVGDKVLTKSGTYQPVYWIHRSTTKPTKFLQIHTEDNVVPLEITPYHMLYVADRGAPIPAVSVKVGDAIVGMNHHKKNKNEHQAMMHKVVKVREVVRDGYYGPFTLDGTIVVNEGLVASNYPTVTNSSTDTGYFGLDLGGIRGGGVTLPLSEHFVLQAFLSPLRLVCLGVSSDFCRGSEQDLPPWFDLGFALLDILQGLPYVLQAVALVLVSTGLTPFILTEFAYGAVYGPLMVLIGACVVYQCRKKGELKQKKF